MEQYMGVDGCACSCLVLTRAPMACTDWRERDRERERQRERERVGLYTDSFLSGKGKLELRGEGGDGCWSNSQEHVIEEVDVWGRR